MGGEWEMIVLNGFHFRCVSCAFAGRELLLRCERRPEALGRTGKMNCVCELARVMSRL